VKPSRERGRHPKPAMAHGSWMVSATFGRAAHRREALRHTVSIGEVIDAFGPQADELFT
jgi:hypothetical protein